MLRYRAASFFGRLYAPEILMGMHSVEEAVDIKPEPIKVNKEQERLNFLINDCSTIEELMVVKEHINADDAHLQEVYETKLLNLQNETNEL
jgi:hypothetical protein